MKILEGLKTVALLLVAVALFVMSYVIYDVMGKHSRFTAVDFNEEGVVVMDTHTGQVWSTSYDLQEADSPKTLNATNAKVQPAGNRVAAKLGK